MFIGCARSAGSGLDAASLTTSYYKVYTLYIGRVLVRSPESIIILPDNCVEVKTLSDYQRRKVDAIITPNGVNQNKLDDSTGQK